ncbi:MAG: transglycosylase SLT domain-containing protein [Myxococcota bacterium]|nr:transglycosylase SLT domain-containing protein [Myxococcota bacterium]
MLSILFSLCIPLSKADDTLWNDIGGVESPKEPKEEVEPTTKELLQLINPQQVSLPISYDERVIYWLDWFRGPGKSTYRRWIKRSGLYRNEIIRELRNHQLPADLLYLAMIESGFSTKAVSSAEAVGIWQFIPSTGSAYGLQISKFIDERRDPLRSTQAAIQYLKKLKLEFAYWHLAIAAYNTGEGNVQKAILKHNTADFWYLSAKEALADETIDYVPKIIAASVLEKNPGLFGINLPKHQKPLERARVTYSPKKSISISTLSEYADLSVSEFQTYNPHLISHLVPKSDFKINLYLPVDKVNLFNQNIQKSKRTAKRTMGEQLSEAERAKYQPPTKSAQHHAHQHIVKEGETISQIAAKWSIRESSLREWNDIAEKDEPKTDQILRLLPKAKKKWVNHVVAAKETLASIAKKYDCSVEEIRTWNALSETEKVRTGRQLFLKAKP